MNHIPTDVPFMCDFAVDFFNDRKFVDAVCLKSIFPYSSLNRLVDGATGLIQESVLLEPIPPISEFKNDLTDPKSGSGELSQSDYDSLKQLTNELGIHTFGELLFYYNVCDVYQVLLCMRVIEKYYYEKFGLSI